MQSFTRQLGNLGELSPELRREIALNFDDPGEVRLPVTQAEVERRLIRRIVAIVCAVCALVIATSA